MAGAKYQAVGFLQPILGRSRSILTFRKITAPNHRKSLGGSLMKAALFAALLAVSVAFAPWTTGAQSQQADSGQTRYQSFQTAQQEQWRKTADLRQQVLLDQAELRAMLINPKTTQDALLKKQKELQESRAKLEREQLLYQYQMGRKYPELMESYGMMGYGGGMGYGMGYGMMGYGMGYGMGPGMMGYGSGTGCGMGYGMMGGGYGMGPGAMGGYHMGQGMTGGHPMGPGMMGGTGQ